jgi:hypothetical protein
VTPAVDDIVIVPLGIWLAVKLVPPALMTEAIGAARRSCRSRRFSRW